MTGVDNPSALSYTLAWWQANRAGGGLDVRGEIDTQYAFDDGSVRRYDRVSVDDDRFARVPSLGDEKNYADAHRELAQPPAD